MRMLKSTHKKGDRINHDWVNCVSNFINTLQILGGEIRRTNNLKNCLIVPNVADESQPFQGFSFMVLPTSATTIGVCGGYCKYASSAEVEKSSVSLDVSTSGSVYITLDLSTGIFSDIQFGDIPAEAGIKVFRIADVNFSSDSITSIVQRRFGDIYTDFPLGTRTLFKGIFLREYDEDGNLIAAGSETGTTEADIDSGHQLLPTWDYVRAHS